MTGLVLTVKKMNRYLQAAVNYTQICSSVTFMLQTGRESFLKRKHTAVLEYGHTHINVMCDLEEIKTQQNVE